MLLNTFQIFFTHSAGSKFSNSFKSGNDIEFFPFKVAWFDRATINIDCWNVSARNRHHAAWHIFIATTDHDNTILPKTVHASLDTVGDHFTRN